MLRSDLAVVSGPGAVVVAMTYFMNNATAGRHIQDGIIVGENNRSIRVLGDVNGFVRNDFSKKKQRYHEMNMTHYHESMTGVKRVGSCYKMRNVTKTRNGFTFENKNVEFLKFPPGPSKTAAQHWKQQASNLPPLLPAPNLSKLLSHPPPPPAPNLKALLSHPPPPPDPTLNTFSSSIIITHYLIPH